MVVAVGGSAFAIDMSQLDLSSLLDGTVTTQNSTTVTVDEGDGFTAHFTGVGFAYDAFGHPAAGTITGISEDYHGQTTLALTSVSVNAAQFYSWVVNNDNSTALITTFGGNDTLTGTAFDDVLGSFGGHDYVAGGPGADTIFGGSGNDHLYGQSSNGGPDAADSISGGDGSDYIQGNAGNDTIDGGNGSDRINGGGDNDNIIGGDGNDTVNGNLGNDIIEGDGGNDSLRGGQGNDTIDGGGADDVTSGDKGIDLLTGGSGYDTFKFAAGDASVVSGATDVITDYAHGTDHLSFGFSVSAVISGGSQSSEASAQSAAQQLLVSVHEVVATQIGADTYLFWNGTGGTTVDSALELKGVTATSIGTVDFS